MDANLVATELEMALLAKLLEGKFVNASSNLTLPASVLLHLLRTYLGPQVTLGDLRGAAQLSPVLTWTPYTREIVIEGVGSADGVRLNVHRWNPYAATRAPFDQKLNEHADRPRPPIAATSFKGGALGLRGERFEVRNEGYGTQDDLNVTSLDLPDWVEGSFTGNAVTLKGKPGQAGVYAGPVTVHTTANPLTLHVTARSADYHLPPGDELTLDELLPDHPDLDRGASEAFLEAHLLHLQYERLPGGLFIRRGVHQANSRTESWWLSEEALTSGTVPASGYPSQFRLFLDVDGRTDRYDPLDVTVEHGQLGGEFAELFDLLDVQAGQKLTLSAYQGGFKAALGPAEPWRMASGHTYWLQGPREAALAQTDVLEYLLRRCDDKNITVNLLLSGEGELPGDLVRQHRAGRLTIRWADETLPLKLLVCGDSSAGFAPPYGSLQRPVTIPQALWEVSVPLQGQDYREQAWQRGWGAEGTSDNGLLDLELSVAMARLARALAPAPSQGSVRLTEQQRNRLLVDLPYRARQFDVNERPIVAAPHLQALRLTAEQVNAGANGYRVTQGGYLVRRFQDLGRQREWARYVGHLYGGVLHHSQLRKLAEAFTEQKIEPTSFVVASLDGMGWAGNGYRRPRQAWEPFKRDLPAFVADALLHFDSREQAVDWLRRNVAASDNQLTRALHKAETLLPSMAAVAPTPTVGTPPPGPTKGPTTPRSSVKASPPPVAAPPPMPGRAAGRPDTPSAPRAGERQQVSTSPAPAHVHPPLSFAPLLSLSESLPDPRQVPFSLVTDAVQRLVIAEGPITESWLVRRYATLAKLNPVQVRLHVVNAAELASIQGIVFRHCRPGGFVDYCTALPTGTTLQVRERGTRQAEDVPLQEWCALFKALGLHYGKCGEETAYKAAINSYRFGNAGASALPLIAMAWQSQRPYDLAPA